MRRHPFAAVNLISDPIHGYIELTKRLAPGRVGAAGLPDEDVAEEDLLDTAWLQRLRRISQLQSARWVFPTAEHSRFTHGLGVMHEAGLWARSLYPSLRVAPWRRPATTAPSRPRGWSSRPCAWPGCSTTSATDRSPTSSTTTSWPAFEAPADPRRPGAKRLTHEDLSARIIEDELGPLLRGLRRAPGAVAERDAFADGETIDPAWVAFLIAKPALADPAMPRWVRWLAPLLSGVFMLKGKGSGTKRIGLRADMDALPMEENTNLRWRSTIPGRFHGCGHDGHTTMLLGTARYLAETRNFDGTVHFIFQPAEEGLGGARAMIKDGLFEKFPCDEIYGLHNAPDLNHGEIAILPGPAMAGADFFDIVIDGYGAHGAMPERSKDPVMIAMTLGQALQTIVSRNVDPHAAGGAVDHPVPRRLRLQCHSRRGEIVRHRPRLFRRGPRADPRADARDLRRHRRPRSRSRSQSTSATSSACWSTRKSSPRWSRTSRARWSSPTRCSPARSRRWAARILPT